VGGQADRVRDIAKGYRLAKACLEN